MSDVARPRLVFASRRAPYPLDNGARIRTFHLLEGLARSFDTVLVTYDHHPDSPDGSSRVGQLETLMPGVGVVTAPGVQPGKRAHQLASVARRQSWTLGRYRTPAFMAALAGAVASHRPDIVHFDDPGVALAAPFADVLNVYSAHNLEHAILRHESHVGTPPRRAFNAIEARKVRREERRIWRMVDLCLAVSPLDGAAMSAGGARRVELCPNGVDAVEPLPPRPRGIGEPLHVLFVGSGSYAPYERGLAWMVREVLPRVRSQIPIVFDVVGTPPAHPVSGEGVRYRGRVPAVEPYYEAADVVVVPVFEGSGTRLKVIEAAAYGRPVVSTRLGAEGLPLVAGRHYLQADLRDDFAAAVLSLAQSAREPAGLARMVASAREAITPLMWPRIVEELVALYLSELERVGAPGAATHAAAITPRARLAPRPPTG
jgi:glycosyltransferase involved in cell wall biosynthesis